MVSPIPPSSNTDIIHVEIMLNQTEIMLNQTELMDNCQGGSLWVLLRSFETGLFVLPLFDGVRWAPFMPGPGGHVFLDILVDFYDFLSIFCYF